MENKIPKAVEYFEQNYVSNIEDGEVYAVFDIHEAMIEFAKLHVKAAPRSVVNEPFVRVLDEDRVLNSYPLENIK